MWVIIGGVGGFFCFMFGGFDCFFLWVCLICGSRLLFFRDVFSVLGFFGYFGVLCRVVE